MIILTLSLLLIHIIGKKCKLSLFTENHNLIKTYKLYFSQNINTKATICQGELEISNCLSTRTYSLLLDTPEHPIEGSNFASLLKYNENNEYPNVSTYAVINKRDYDEIKSFYGFSYINEYAFINCKLLINIGNGIENNENIFTSLVCEFIVLLIIFVTWLMICFLKDNVGVVKVHKVFLFLIFLKIMYNNLLIAYLLYYRDIIQEFYDYNFFEGILMLINGFYIASIWYFLIIISKGWQVCYSEFSYDDYHKFFLLYVTIFISLIFDDLLYFLIDEGGLECVILI
jgi:hypothetical protein